MEIKLNFADQQDERFSKALEVRHSYDEDDPSLKPQDSLQPNELRESEFYRGTGKLFTLHVT